MEGRKQPGAVPFPQSFWLEVIYCPPLDTDSAAAVVSRLLGEVCGHHGSVQVTRCRLQKEKAVPHPQACLKLGFDFNLVSLWFSNSQINYNLFV